MNVDILLNDELWDPNIFKHLIYPKYLDAQAAYWTNLDRFNQNSRKLLSSRFASVYTNLQDSVWFSLSIKDRALIFKNITEFSFGGLNYIIDEKLTLDNL